MPCGRELATANSLGTILKLSGYTAGKPLVDKEGFYYIPVGVLGEAGLTWAGQPNDAQGQPVVTQNGSPEAYDFTAEVGTKLTDFMGRVLGVRAEQHVPRVEGRRWPD
jgi:hypothetical protein